MSNKKQTAVEWLIEELQKRDMDVLIRDLYKQAKEIEKEQITEGFKKGLEYWNGEAWKLIDIEQYYKETYENRD